MRRQNERMVRRIINELLVGIKTPQRPSTPEGAYLTVRPIWIVILHSFFLFLMERFQYKNRQFEFYETCFHKCQRTIDVTVNKSPRRKKSFFKCQWCLVDRTYTYFFKFFAIIIKFSEYFQEKDIFDELNEKVKRISNLL